MYSKWCKWEYFAANPRRDDTWKGYLVFYGFSSFVSCWIIPFAAIPKVCIFLYKCNVRRSLTRLRSRELFFVWHFGWKEKPATKLTKPCTQNNDKYLMVCKQSNTINLHQVNVSSRKVQKKFPQLMCNFHETFGWKEVLTFSRAKRGLVWW